MRLWAWQLFPYLSELQFKGQLREATAIMRDWQTKGTTNHILINKVMEYPKGDLTSYFWLYNEEYYKRYGVRKDHLMKEFVEFSKGEHFNPCPFKDWHNKEYLRVCYGNLYEKHVFGVGKSRITDEEWQRLVDGYRQITGEDYKI